MKRKVRNAGIVAAAMMSATAAMADETREGIWAPYVKGDLVPEIVAELPGAVGNIAFTPDAEIIYSHHPFYGNPVKVAKLGEDGKSFTPYPNEEWNTAKPDSDDYLDTVLGRREPSSIRATPLKITESRHSLGICSRRTAARNTRSWQSTVNTEAKTSEVYTKGIERWSLAADAMRALEDMEW